MAPASLLLVLLACCPPGDGPADPTPAPAPPPLPTAGERLERALGLLRSGGEGPARVAAEAAAAPAVTRRAALEAIATLEPGQAPAGTLPGALAALEDADPVLRTAAVRALIAVGPEAEKALAAIAEADPPPPNPVPSLPPARGALFDLRRAAVEAEFLALWSPNDGSFRGMYAPLRKHGAVAARVLVAIALDRRLAAGEILPFGPYSWIRPPAPEQERPEVRGRALEALEDAGDEDARDLLARSLRRRPAPRLYDPSDDDPIPASLDDALRKAIAMLGDEQPLYDLITASQRGGGRFGRRNGDPIEMRRQAMAFSTLAEAPGPEKTAKLRRDCFSRAADLWQQSIDVRQSGGWGAGVDGVDFYNLACILARRDAPGDRDQALDHLARSLDTYSVTSTWVARDGDLSNLRGEPAFAGILKRLRDREAAMKIEEPK